MKKSHSVAVVTVAERLQDIQESVGPFVEDPNLRLGDADSGHGVLFGELEGYGSVAIKPFTQIGKARAEQNNLLQVRELGFEALEPAAVALSGLSKVTTAGYLITKRHPDLRHLGQLKWARSATSEEVETIIKPTLELVSGTMAAWHGAGIFHGDAQPKNMAYTSNGSSVYVDAEGTRFGGDDKTRLGLAREDMGRLGSTILINKLLYDVKPERRINELSERLLDPYLAAVEQRDPVLASPLQRAAIQDAWADSIRKHLGTPVLLQKLSRSKS
jgi:hypothetical protein